MIALLPLLVLSRLAWVTQDIPNVDLEISPTLAFRLADIDGDGLPDLVFPDKVFFHNRHSRESGNPVASKTAALGNLDSRFRGNDDGARKPFDFANGVELPPPDKVHPGIDIFGNTIYQRLPDRLRAITWKEKKWEMVLDQPITWPSPGGAAAEFERFLYDLNGDHVPEIVIPGEDGIHIFQMKSGTYQDVARWDVLPEPIIDRGEPRALWPPDARQVAFPDTTMACRFSVDREDAAIRVTVVSNEQCGEKQARFRIKRHFFNASDFSPLPERNSQEISEPMPAFMRARRLGANDRIDFAGGDWEFSENSVLPEPVFETCASTDGGKTIQRFRTTSFRPQCSFADFNGDGNLDMVTETSGCFSGGVRETVSRFLASRALTHDIAVHFQSSDGVFSKAPDITAHFSIELDEPPLRGSSLFRQYEAGELVDVTGDFNGDGKRDILIHDKPRNLSIYLQKTGGFSDKPDAAIEIEPDARVQVLDVDGDGRSDIVVHWRNQEDGQGRGITRVFFSREEP